MSSFQHDYAELYDLFYSKKNYDRETEIIRRLIQEYRPRTSVLLDYGCGTGNHAARLGADGYRVFGVDVNDNMLDIARRKLGTQSNLSFLNLKEKDAVPAGSVDVFISMFDVLSYLNTNDDIWAWFEYIDRVLAPEGLLIFDFWYAPGVLHLKPEMRWSTFQKDDRRILRLTEPVHDSANSMVQVTHHVYQFEKDRLVSEFVDPHSMRYFAKNEIALWLRTFQIELLKFGTWAHLEIDPTENDWSALAVARKRVS